MTQTPLTRRRFAGLAAGLGLAAALPSAALAEELSLNAISAYLNSIQTAEAPFTQINADGTVAKGTVFIKRPGRVRFEYDPPEKSLVLASAGQVAIFDSRSNAPPEQYPLSQTPLSIILERNVNLGQRGMVVGHTSDGKTTSVVAQDPRHPDYGTIQLVFTGSPVELRQWVITDGTGSKTTVVLAGLKTGIDYPPSKFSLETERRKRGL